MENSKSKYCIQTLILALLLSIVCLLVAMPGYVKAADPALSRANITVYIGKTADLELENASNDVIWKSEDETIAKVDDDGTVTPVSVGTTKVYATYKNVDYSCNVTVKKPYLTQDRIEVFPFEYFQLGITGTKVKKWEISDETIMTVQYSTNPFRIRALAEGEATFTIIGKDKQKYECLVVVKPCTFKASYYDKKHTKVKKISYYVDDRIAQCDAYYKGTGLKYSIKYIYDKDTYTEIQLNQRGTLNSKTVYDYSNNMISETKYTGRATLDNADSYKLSEKYVDESGLYHENQYTVLYKDVSNSTTSLVSEVIYDNNMKKYKSVNYNFSNGVKYDEETYFPEDEKLASSILYNEEGNIFNEVYYNQNPYFINKKVRHYKDYREECFYDLSGRCVREVTYDVNNNIILDTSY